MRKITMCKKKLRTDGGEKLTLIYSITVDELSPISSSAGIESYGACISIQESGEELCLRHITLRSCEIFSLTSLLSSNYVTPSTLSDIVYDWLCR